MRRVLACFALMAAATMTVANTPADLKGMRERIETLRKDIDKAEGNRSEAADSLKESERAISQANRALNDLGAQKHSVQTQLQELGRNSKGAGDMVALQNARLSKLLHDEYVNHARGHVQMLFSGENPAGAAREIHYAAYVSRAQAKLIEALRGNLRELTRLANAARDRSIELAEIENRQRAEREHLARESAARKNVLLQLSTQIRSQRREVSTLERNEKRLGSLIEKLARLAMPKDPQEKPKQRGVRNEVLPESGVSAVFSTLRGKLQLPSRGELVNRFGTQREDGGTTWKGLFIKAGQGEEVRAVAPGRVVFADWMRGFGNLLIVDHGGEYLSIYGNNETVLKQVGDTVGSGDPVARVGNSGGNPETGLYFELRHQGKPFDPLLWVRR